jgi:hypothetical protein
MMKRQTDACPLKQAPSSSKAHVLSSTRFFGGDKVGGPEPAPLRLSVLAMAGAAMVLLGCQQDPGGTAPGGLEPSASRERSDVREDTGPGGGPSADPTSTSDDLGEGAGSGTAGASGSGGFDADDGEDDSGEGGASGSDSGATGSGSGASGSGSGGASGSGGSD